MKLPLNGRKGAGSSVVHIPTYVGVLQKLHFYVVFL
jgi:hypothetical protein